MDGKILIYGATGGIGSRLARCLHAQGVSLHLAGRDADRLASLAGELDAACTSGDILDEGTAQRTAEEAGSPLRGLVYCAGTINLKPFTRLTLEDYNYDFQVNAAGAALAVQAALPALKKSSENASVVLFSSVAADQGFRLHASMGMAKAAVSG
ncbi:MAG TPA: SDR family oxidoreductase, partial [Tichowtungia sp.]|nr:SDR family oxidoreductase [Tichowtungia sp.]